MTGQYTEADLDAPEAEQSDAELITAVRGGDESSFATLWSRHEAAAHRLARQISNPSNADDLVSEAFLRVLRALKSGSGPDGAFRPYLFSALRRINIDNGRSYYTRIALTDDERDLDVTHSDSAADVLADNDDSSAAWRAWNSLPDSSKTLLWHLIIEEETPAQIAPLIGTTPNGVSSRAVRAKERLRQAFLQQHLLDAETEPCRQARQRFGEYVRDALSARDRAEVRSHLDTCASCQTALFEVSDINQTMKVIIGPVVLGGVAVAGHYIAAGTLAAGKGSIFAQVTHLGHLLKNPAAATATAVTVVAVGVASAFGINAIDSSSSTPLAVAAPVAETSTNQPAVVAAVTPTSIDATPTPAPTPTPTPSPSPTPTPTVRRTTPKPVVPVDPTTPIEVPTPTVTTPTPTITTPSPTVTPNPVVAVLAITSPTQDAFLATIVFTVPAEWNIVSIDEPNNFHCGTLGQGTTYGLTATCYALIVNSGDQAFTVSVKPSTSPAVAGELIWTYTDSNTPGPGSTGSATIHPAT